MASSSMIRGIFASKATIAPTTVPGACTQQMKLHMALRDAMGPMMTMGTAGILLHRFFAQRSLLRSDKLVAATACFFLAGKIEDTPRSLTRIAENMHRCYCDEFQSMAKEDAEARWRNTAYQENFKAAVVAAERAILFSLGFDFIIYLPHNCLVDYIAKDLQPHIEKACKSAPGLDLKPANVQQAAWDICNESLRSSVVLTHTPIEIAVAAMYFSLKMHKLNQHIPGGLRWYADWNITEDRIQGVVQAVLEMYEEVACQVAPVQAGVNGIRVVPPAASPTPDMLRGPQQQPTPTAQQQAIQKSNAMLAAAQQRQAAVVGSGSQSDPQLAQHLRPQSRAVAPANMFMPASSTKVQRGIDQKPARHAAERESRPDSLSSGHASAAGVKGAHPAVAAAARSPALGNSHQTGQTYAAELIETDIL